MWRARAIERVKAHKDAEPEAIRNVRADIPEEVVDVITRMMAKDPSERFQTPAEIADALAPFVDPYRTTPTEKTNSASDTGTTSSRLSWWPPTIAQSTVCTAFVLFFAGLIYVATDKGTLVVDSEDDSIQIIIRPASVDSNGRQVQSESYANR